MFQNRQSDYNSEKTELYIRACVRFHFKILRQIVTKFKNKKRFDIKQKHHIYNTIIHITVLPICIVFLYLDSEQQATCNGVFICESGHSQLPPLFNSNINNFSGQSFANRTHT